MHRMSACTCIRADAANKLEMPGAPFTTPRVQAISAVLRLRGAGLEDRGNRSDCEQKVTESQRVKHASGRREVRSGRAEQAGWIREAKHSQCQQFGVRRCSGASTRRNIFFKAKPRNSCAGAKRRGRVFEARSRVLFAATGSHTSCARWRKPRRYPPFERTPLLEHDRINKHHDRFSSPFGCILRFFHGYPASMAILVPCMGREPRALRSRSEMQGGAAAGAQHRP